jgi:hypothetical protein
MKNKALLVTVCFLAISVFVVAQQKTELKVKVVKSENGETITIDTTLNSEDGHVYFYSDGEVNQKKVDSILKSLGIENNPTIEFIASKLDDLDAEHVKQIWITKDGDIDEDITIRVDGDVKVLETTKSFSIIKNFDEEEVKSEYIIYTGDDVEYKEDGNGNKIIISSSSDSESYLWTASDSKQDNKVQVIAGISFDINTNNLIEVIGGDGDSVQISEIIIKKGDGDCKTIEVIIDGDDFEDENKIIELEKALEGTGEKVKIVKYETEDGKYVVKAEIMDCELSEEDQQKAKEIGLEDKSLLELKKFKLFPNPTEGVINLEFEIENKENTLVKVYNQEGKSVYSEKIRKFKGLYSKQIDISKEDKGVYFLRIIQGNKSVTKKVLKK